MIQENRSPFNSAVETGLKALVILTEAYPESYSLDKLVIFDYIVVHSADIDDSVRSLHPATPMRSGELIVRRELVEKGLRLYESRGLIERKYRPNGFAYSATEDSAAFLKAMKSAYLLDLKRSAIWLVKSLGSQSLKQLRDLVDQKIGEWGTEFLFDSENNSGRTI